MTVVQPKRNIPNIAVVIPLYNKGKYIARTLDSVLTQTYQNFEVIVVNDGSTDDGPAIVDSYKDSRIKLIHQDNAGPGAARNRGLSESQASLISFLDADDEWFPNFLEKSFEHLDKNPNCVLSVTGHVRGVERTGWEEDLPGLAVNQGVWRLPMDIEPRLMKFAVDFLHSGAVLCSRTVLEQFGGFYTKHRCTYGEDSYLWLQVLLNHAIYRDPTPLMWHHTEASELGHGRKEVQPPWPKLTDPDPIRRGCPLGYRSTLERCLAYYALISAFRHVDAGDTITAQKILKCFPVTQAFVWDYTRIRYRLVKAKLSAVLNKLQHQFYKASV